MHICHFSDWHAKLRPLPEADIYVCTGDMLPNFEWPKPGTWALIERQRQEIWMADHTIKVPGPVVCVRGNHDFCDLAALFVAPEVHEIVLPTDCFIVNGLRFAGMRGISYMGMHWSDELSVLHAEHLGAQIPPCDVLVTHSPPYKILDYFGPNNDVHVGLRCLPGGLTPKAHLFGHIHECGGQVKTMPGYPTQFSNAACTVNMVEI